MKKGRLVSHVVCGSLTSYMCVKVFIYFSPFHWSLWRIVIHIYFFLTGVEESPNDASATFSIAQIAYFITLLWSYFAPLSLIAKLLTLLSYLLHSRRKSKNLRILMEPKEVISGRAGFLIAQTRPSQDCSLARQKQLLLTNT